MVSLVLLRLDFGSATLAGIPVHLMSWLQSMMNAAARCSIAGLRHADHITTKLRSQRLHALEHNKITRHIDLSLSACHSPRISLPRSVTCGRHSGDSSTDAMMPCRLRDLSSVGNILRLMSLHLAFGTVNSMMSCQFQHFVTSNIAVNTTTATTSKAAAATTTTTKRFLQHLGRI